MHVFNSGSVLFINLGFFAPMAASGYISAANLNCLLGARHMSNPKLGSADARISLSFGGSDSMGVNVRPASIRAPKRNHFSPLRVVCVDYPRPELENTVNFVEAAYLSSTFRASPRPLEPLKVVIAGAGNKQAVPMLVYFVLCMKNVFLLPNFVGFLALVVLGVSD